MFEESLTSVRRTSSVRTVSAAAASADEAAAAARTGDNGRRGGARCVEGPVPRDRGGSIGRTPVGRW